MLSCPTGRILIGIPLRRPALVEPPGVVGVRSKAFGLEKVLHCLPYLQSRIEANSATLAKRHPFR